MLLSGFATSTVPTGMPASTFLFSCALLAICWIYITNVLKHCLQASHVFLLDPWWNPAVEVSARVLVLMWACARACGVPQINNFPVCAYSCVLLAVKTWHASAVGSLIRTAHIQLLARIQSNSSVLLGSCVTLSVLSHAACVFRYIPSHGPQPLPGPVQAHHRHTHHHCHRSLSLIVPVCCSLQYQAMDRIHRLGQFKPITVVRFIIGGELLHFQVACPWWHFSSCSHALLH